MATKKTNKKVTKKGANRRLSEAEKVARYFARVMSFARQVRDGGMTEEQFGVELGFVMETAFKAGVDDKLRARHKEWVALLDERRAKDAKAPRQQAAPKKKYRTDAEWCADQMLQYVGAKITGVATDPQGEFFALEVTLKGKVTALWIQRDAEGNGGGFISPQDVTAQKRRAS